MILQTNLCYLIFFFGVVFIASISVKQMKMRLYFIISSFVVSADCPRSDVGRM